MKRLLIEPLAPDAFAPFGDVIQTRDSAWYPINQGTTRRYHDLARVQAHGESSHVGISLAVGQAFTYPITIRMLERHPKGSQAWIPRAGITQGQQGGAAPFLVVVAPNGQNGNAPDESGLRVFMADPDQGVNYHSGTWHHPLLSFGQAGEFVVIDRIGTDDNCDECPLSQGYLIDG
jgi:ureidoglycolate lyase